MSDTTKEKMAYNYSQANTAASQPTSSFIAERMASNPQGQGSYSRQPVNKEQDEDSDDSSEGEALALAGVRRGGKYPLPLT